MSNPLFNLNPNPALMSQPGPTIPVQPTPQSGWEQLFTDPSIRYLIGNILTGALGGGNANASFNQSYQQSISNQQQQQALEEEARSNKRNEEIRAQQVELARQAKEMESVRQEREDAFNRIAVIQQRGGKVPPQLWERAGVSEAELPPDARYRIGRDGSLVRADAVSVLSEDYGPDLPLKDALDERKLTLDNLQKQAKTSENPVLAKAKDIQAAAKEFGITLTPDDIRGILDSSLKPDKGGEKSYKNSPPIWDAKTKGWFTYDYGEKKFQRVKGEGPTKDNGVDTLALDKQIATITNTIANKRQGRTFVPAEQLPAYDNDIAILEQTREGLQSLKMQQSALAADPLDAIMEELNGMPIAQAEAYLDAAGIVDPQTRVTIRTRLMSLTPSH